MMSGCPGGDPVGAQRPPAPVSKRHEWSEHLRGHRPALERYAFRLCRNRDEACDLVQDTLERAWKHNASFGAEPPPRAWLLRVLTNLFLDHRRRRRPAADASIAVEDIVFEPPPPPPPVTPEDALVALTRIPRQLQELVEAHHLRGLRYGEIAEHLAIPIGTVGTRLFRARRELKRLLLPPANDRELGTGDDRPRVR
jgi:RNA polymerase sigma-70 factor (ECF subfamily)